MWHADVLGVECNVHPTPQRHELKTPGTQRLNSLAVCENHRIDVAYAPLRPAVKITKRLVCEHSVASFRKKAL